MSAEPGMLTTRCKFSITLTGFIHGVRPECWGRRRAVQFLARGCLLWRRAHGSVGVWEWDTQLAVCASTPNNAVTWESVLGSDEFQRSGGRESVRMNRWVRIKALLDRAGQINLCALACSRNPAVQEVARSEPKQTRDICDKRGQNSY